MKHALIASALLLGACAFDPRDEYEWVHDPTLPKCERTTWEQRPFEELRDSCGALACAFGCVVRSGYSEEQARHMQTGGESLYEHERKHTEKQLNHPKRKGT